jgi:hypothetical protein
MRGIPSTLALPNELLAPDRAWVSGDKVPGPFLQGHAVQAVKTAQLPPDNTEIPFPAGHLGLVGFHETGEVRIAIARELGRAVLDLGHKPVTLRREAVNLPPDYVSRNRERRKGISVSRDRLGIPALRATGNIQLVIKSRPAHATANYRVTVITEHGGRSIGRGCLPESHD